jgi:DNA-binding NarL/FixJ family response regulator
MTIRLLVADDQTLVRSGLRKLLESEPDFDVVGEAGDGEQAVWSAARLKADVVLMDIRMPVMDGLEATARITGGADPPRVLVLTTYDLDEYVYRALRAGASGFMLKDAPPEQLIEGVRVIARGDALLAPQVTRRLIAEFVRRPEQRLEPRLEELTSRERDVLGLVARGLSNREIAQKLGVGEATVRTHVGNVLAKLQLRDRVQAVVFAYETGFAQPGHG